MTRTARARALRFTAYAAFVLLVVVVFARADLRYNWRWAEFLGGGWPQMLGGGLVLTLEVSLASMALALPLGVLIGLCRTAHDPGARLLGFGYVEVFRGTPLLVQVMIWYFVLSGPLGLARFGEALLLVLGPLNGLLGVPVVQPDHIASAVVALSCFASSYIAEIVRAGIQSIDRGQLEAARSLGLTHVQAMRHVVLPQALRRILPPLASEFIALVKDSSLASVIGLAELTQATRNAQSGAYMTFEPWLVTAGLYLAINVILSLGVRRLEARLGVARRGEAIQ